MKDRSRLSNVGRTLWSATQMSLVSGWDIGLHGDVVVECAAATAAAPSLFSLIPERREETGRRCQSGA